jgi:S-DNA-T family DNA segregation ATPase FtsK/SpoIIIE
LSAFGLVSVLLMPLLYIFARKLWRLAEEDDGSLAHADQRWWRPLGILLIAMLLLGTVLSLAFTARGGSLPASSGGHSGA